MIEYEFTTTINILDEKFFNAKQLIFIDVDKLPDNLSECKQLQSIIIKDSTMNVVNLPEQLVIVKIEQSSIGVLNINKRLEKFRALSDIDVINIPIGNKIRWVSDMDEFYPFIREFKNLKEIYILNNIEVVFPDWINELTHLTEINLKKDVKVSNNQTFSIKKKNYSGLVLFDTYTRV